MEATIKLKSMVVIVAIKQAEVKINTRNEAILRMEDTSFIQTDNY